MDVTATISRDRAAMGLFGIAMVAAFLIMLLVRSQLLTFHALNMGGVDQNIVLGTQRLLLDLPLYGDPEAPPFPMVQYSPVFFHIHAATCRIMSIGPYDVQPMYVAGRVLCLLFNLLSVLLLVDLCRRQGIHRILAWGIGCLFFASLTDMYFLRPDALYMLFVIAHVHVISTALKGDVITWTDHALAGLFASLCVFTKQSGLIVPAFTGVFFLTQLRWRDLFSFTGSVMIWSALILGWVLMSNPFDLIFKNLVMANVNGIDIGHMLRHLTGKYGWFILVWLLIGALISVHVLRTDRNVVHRYLAIAVIATLLWSLITAMKRGSNTNYYTEARILTAMLAVILISEGSERYRVLRTTILLFMPFTALLGAGMFFSAVNISHYRSDRPEPYHISLAVAEKVREHGLGTDDYVFIKGRDYLEIMLAPHTLLNAKDIVAASKGGLKMDLSQLHRTAMDGSMRYIVVPAVQDPLDLTYEGVPLTGFRPLFEHEGYIILINERVAGQVNSDERSAL